MAQQTFGKIRDWVEPAHPAIVKLHEELILIYKAVRDCAQSSINEVFDNISRRVGYVVATSLPVVLEFDRKGLVKNVAMGAEHLRGTLFDEGMQEALKPLQKSAIEGIASGNYRILVIWSDALKLKLYKDWMEPAHAIGRAIKEVDVRRVGPQEIAVADEVREPAHWFDPGIAIELEEAVMISAIDEVFPELRLAERISVHRTAGRKFVVPSEVEEPAHFQASSLFKNEEFVRELESLIRKVRR